ncbi:MAG: cytochrome c-type biogenesis protein [Xanthobacteraceae bacterium]|jgi:cytochrome c-type biogenesis protein CcmH
MKILHALLLLVALMVSSQAWAVEPDEMLSNPALEARARAISKQLRCMVCQNESIDESQAPLARDLRVLVRQRIMAGDSDTQIINFLVSRYGEFILLKPPLSWHTLALWGAPPALLILGILMIVVVERRRATGQPALGAATRLSAAEEARLSEILHTDTGP